MFFLVFQVSGFDFFSRRADGHAVAAPVAHLKHQRLPHEARLPIIEMRTVFLHVVGGNDGFHHIIKPGVIVSIGMSHAGHEIKGLVFADGSRGTYGSA